MLCYVYAQEGDAAVGLRTTYNLVGFALRNVCSALAVMLTVACLPAVADEQGSEDLAVPGGQTTSLSSRNRLSSFSPTQMGDSRDQVILQQTEVILNQNETIDTQSKTIARLVRSNSRQQRKLERLQNDVEQLKLSDRKQIDEVKRLRQNVLEMKERKKSLRCFAEGVCEIVSADAKPHHNGNLPANTGGMIGRAALGLPLPAPLRPPPIPRKRP